MDIQGLMKSFLEWKRIAGYAKSVIAVDKNRLTILLDYLEEKRMTTLESLSKATLSEFPEYLLYRPSKRNGCFLTPEYRNQILIIVKMFFRWLYDQDYTAHDLAKHLSYFKRSQKLPRNILTQQEMEKLLELPDITDHLGFRDRLILEIFYGTGIRLQELIKLQIADIDLSTESLHVRHGKGNKERMVPLGGGLCQMIEQYLLCIRPNLKRRNLKEHYLFPGQDRGKMSSSVINHILKMYQKKSGFIKKVHPHALRHACATHMMQNGAPIRYIQELLGHENINTTQVYTHVTINDLKKAHTKYHPREKR